MSGAGRSDAELLQAHVDGDRDAFGELVARHRDRMWAVALRTSGNPEDAADGLQDAFVAAYRRAASFRGDSAVTTWLHRVVVNACLDRHRRAAVRRAEPLPDDLDDRAHPSVHTSVDRSALDPAAVLVDAERRQQVHAALRELPEEQRICLVLVDLEQWSVAEVSERLGVPSGTVKSRCFRGRAKLAQLLAGLAPGHGGTSGAARASESRDPAQNPAQDPAQHPVQKPARPGGEHR